MTNDKLLNFQYDGVSFEFAIDPAEIIISQTIETTGVWEENQLSLYSDLIPATGTFVDIGANVGVNSLFAHKKMPAARVVAVEPEPRNFERLDRNCQGSGIEIQNIAIADHAGSIGFAGTGTNAHIAAEGENQVRCDTLDNFVDAFQLETIDLLKIDVEGFTDLVLSQSKETLRRTRATIIEFSHGDILSRLTALGEPHDRANAHSEELFDRLRPHFTHFYYISRGDGLVRLDRTADLFEIMFCEAQVGDILASREPRESISAISFAFRNILELKRQNHLRFLEIEGLAATSREQAGDGQASRSAKWLSRNQR